MSLRPVTSLEFISQCSCFKKNLSSLPKLPFGRRRRLKGNLGTRGHVLFAGRELPNFFFVALTKARIVSRTTVMEGQELTEEAQMLVNQGISVRVAQRIAEIFTSGVLSPEELDDRAFDALRNFNEDAALEVLEKFSKSDLSHVQNKSAFLCGVMKTHMEKTRLAAETGEGTVSDVACSADEAKIRELLERTGYTLDITTGQRKYGGPPPSWEGPAPGTGSEKVCSQVFVGKIPRDCFEDELIPLLEECGQIYDFRLMMDPMSGNNRGYGFCTYAAKSQALAAVKNLDNKEIRPGKRLGVCISVANNRLFVGSIPKSKSKHEILEEFQKVTADLVDVIVYLSPDQKGKNRGFAFLEFESHKAAALARRRLSAGKIKVWGTISPTVDWAEPQEEPDEEVMSKVKVVYVRNLSPNITEEQLQEHFGQYGTLERVKKLKDYAFIHFTEREQCIKAIEELNGKPMDGIPIEASLAKPQPAKKDRRYGQQGFGGGMSRGRARGRGGPRGRGRGGYDQYGGDSYGYGGDGYGGYGGGGYGYGGDYSEGYDEGYSGGYDYGGGYGGGYQRGGRGGRPFRGGAPTRGPRGGRGGPRGGSDAGGYGRGGMRGYGGGFRGGNRGGRGGNRGGPRGRGAPFKRKYDDGQGSAGYPESKRQFKSPEQPIQQYGQQPQQQQPQQQYSQTQTWGNEPINQQPLYSTGQDYSTYDYSNTSQVSQQWYQDSYGQ